MYSGNYGFGNAPFNPGASSPPPPPLHQQQHPQHPTHQQLHPPPQSGPHPGPQMMYKQQQFAGFSPGANPQMMQGIPAGMMQSPGMPAMANGQMPAYAQQFPGGPYGQMMPQSFAPNSYVMAGPGSPVELRHESGLDAAETAERASWWS
ncbi:hypothetical protein XA68_15623 [Ophiocordyceps unilateralis]|uniref:Uncharacterized protein n=1 Tax=Ophiocordyceps unilateralis TaxID=268505 RepID=A0A2A9P7V3_OPHUN|nr:hypothetical protein XA68_15623 [Ophiocordyceps unilateralis]